MKFVKGISLFFVYPVLMLGIGFIIGVKTVGFFYPGEQKNSEQVREKTIDKGSLSSNQKGTATNREVSDSLERSTEPEETLMVSASSETLSVDTEYVLEENDLTDHSVVETVWRLPDKYVGMNREQFLEAMELYEAFPPLSEMERGFVSLEVLSFSRERVVVQMNYEYVQPSTSFYLAVKDNEVVVYLEDRETVYINTGILLDTLPEYLQQEIMQMLWIEDEESLYDFLEAYSS